MLDDRVRAVLARLEAEDDAEQESGLPPAQRSLAVGPESGRLLFALVAPNAGCEVLEIGGSRGYSTIWLAAAARITLDATTRSGSVDVRALQVDGSVEKRHVLGTIGGGGAQVRLATRSGSIRVTY